MSGSVNKVILVGRVGKDPEMRSLNDGTRIANLSLATSETWKDKSGQRQERTEWHRIVILNEKLAEVAEKYVKKGALLEIEGALATRKWTDQGGEERYTTEIVLNRFRGELTMLDSPGRGKSARGGAYDAGYDDGPDDTPRSRGGPSSGGSRDPGSRRDGAERAGELPEDNIPF